MRGAVLTRVCVPLSVQELELGSQFVFHSVFACPVSREQGTPDNPPMLLPCGHVLAKQSLQVGFDPDKLPYIYILQGLKVASSSQLKPSLNKEPPAYTFTPAFQPWANPK